MLSASRFAALAMAQRPFLALSFASEVRPVAPGSRSDQVGQSRLRPRLVGEDRAEISDAARRIGRRHDGEADSPSARHRVGEADSPRYRTGEADSPSAADELSPEEQEEVRELAKRDREVRAHEQAHAAAAGDLANGGPSYEYTTGPDGRRYAVGGEVSISLREGKTPEETVRIAERARRAALAPQEPSPQDRKVAAEAAQMAARARAEQRDGDADDGASAGEAKDADRSQAPVFAEANDRLKPDAEAAESLIVRQRYGQDGEATDAAGLTEKSNRARIEPEAAPGSRHAGGREGHEVQRDPRLGDALQRGDFADAVRTREEPERSARAGQDMRNVRGASAAYAYSSIEGRGRVVDRSA